LLREIENKILSAKSEFFFFNILFRNSVWQSGNSSADCTSTINEKLPLSRNKPRLWSTFRLEIQWFLSLG
jgi:hypothetical protein